MPINYQPQNTYFRPLLPQSSIANPILRPPFKLEEVTGEALNATKLSIFTSEKLMHQNFNVRLNQKPKLLPTTFSTREHH